MKFQWNHGSITQQCDIEKYSWNFLLIGLKNNRDNIYFWGAHWWDWHDLRNQMDSAHALLISKLAIKDVSTLFFICKVSFKVLNIFWLNRSCSIIFSFSYYRGGWSCPALHKWCAMDWLKKHWQCVIALCSAYLASCEFTASSIKSWSVTSLSIPDWRREKTQPLTCSCAPLPNLFLKMLSVSDFSLVPLRYCEFKTQTSVRQDGKKKVP